jgi:hypothetical protein
MAAGSAARKASTEPATVVGLTEPPAADRVQVGELAIVLRDGAGVAWAFFAGRRLPLRVASMSRSAASRPVRE